MARIRFPMPTRQRTSGGYGRRRRPMFGVGQPQGRRGDSRGASRGGGMNGMKMRLLIAAGIALFVVISYYANPGDVNHITGERERVAMTNAEDEMRLGQQTAPEMIRMHKGVSDSIRMSQEVQRVGRELLQGLERWIADRQQELQIDMKLENPYEFEFTLLADKQTVNAFALPGGQVFITEALASRLNTIGELAGVLGHEIGHVIERHGNERMAEQQLFSGLAAAGGVLGGDENSARMAQMAAQMVSMSYGREDELESDRWGVILCEKAGYDPRAMIGLMKVLDEASPGGGPPEMMSTHPKPANRIEYIQRVIKDVFPEGVPPGLTP